MTLCTPAEHLSRRAFLKGTVLTAGGAVMNWGGLSGSRTSAAEAGQQQKHCILLWMNGGASQFETFDMKPGRPTGGPFRPIATNVPGTQICELMPKMAQQMDKIAVIRSMQTSQVDHPGGIYLMHTGYRADGQRPLSRDRRHRRQVPGPRRGRPAELHQDLLERRRRRGLPGAEVPAVRHRPRRPPAACSPSRNQSQEVEAAAPRAAAVRRGPVRRRAPRPKPPRCTARPTRPPAGCRSARQVFKIDEEWDKYRDLYGDSEFGSTCLLARRLVEAGVPFVEVGQSSYDSHADNFAGHKGLVPPMEHAWAGLLADLQAARPARRTRSSSGRAKSAARRASTTAPAATTTCAAWSTALAGCGIKGGAVYGETDDDGRRGQGQPGDRRRLLRHDLPGAGHRSTRRRTTPGLRPIPLAPFGSKVVKELLA